MPRLRNGLPRRGFRTAGQSGLLLAIVLLVPQFSRGQDADSSKAANPSNDAGQCERPAFDLSFVPPYARGVVAVRPNAIFRDPAMRPLACMVNEALAQWLQSLKLPANAKLPPIEEIEQIVGYFGSFPGAKEPDDLAFTPKMIRTAHDFDWRKLLRQLDPKTEEIHRGSRNYYKCKLKLFPKETKGTILYFSLPDKRTLLVPSPATCLALQSGKEIPADKICQRPRFAWGKDWKRVEHGVAAAAMDYRWTRGLTREQFDDSPLGDLFPHVSTMAAALDWNDGIDFHAYLACKGEASAKQVKKIVKLIIAGMGQLSEATFTVDPESEELKPVSATGPHEIDPASVPPEIALLMQVYKDLADHAHITRRKSAVHVHTNAKIDLAEVVKLILAPTPAK